MKAKHWAAADFVVTHTSPAYDGSGAVNRFGYCRVCHGDIQSFSGNGKPGPIVHYKSHKNARIAGLVTERRSSNGTVL